MPNTPTFNDISTFSMRNIHTIIAGVVVGLAIIGSTLAQGYYSQRWQDHTNSPELIRMADNLKHVPLRFGDWVGEEIPDTEEILKQYEVAKVNGHRNVSYRHVHSGKVVQIALVCGHHQTIGIHTPDKCMVGAGFHELEGEHERADVIPTDTPNGEMRVRTAQFVRETPTGTINQRMLWTFSHNGEWEASELGRASLAGQLGWFKLYVTVAGTGKNVLDLSESKEFLKEFMPVLNRALFPRTEAATEDVAKA